MKTKTTRTSQNYYTNIPNQAPKLEAATPSTNPLRAYTKIVELNQNHDVKEEAQQVNFDDFSLGTAAEANTPNNLIMSAAG